MTAAPGIGFAYRPSPLLVAATVVVTLLALLAIWASAGPLWLRLAIAVGVAIWAAVAVRRVLRPRVRSLSWRGDGGVDLVLAAEAPDGREAQGGVQAARMLGPLVVLTVRWPPRERAHLWILPDNLDVDTRRRLRMRVGAAGRAGAPSGNADTR